MSVALEKIARTLSVTLLSKTALYSILSALFLMPILPFLTQHAVYAEESIEGNVILILDGSGSMWQQLEGEAKIVTAKEVMTELIEELPAGLDLGLASFGHRRKGDCSDIEMLVPLGPQNRAVLVARLQSIDPKGKTPITKTLEMVGEQLKILEEQASVVLISDGNETCGGDPCAQIRDLKRKGLDVTVHVVGFDVTDEEEQQLACIAEAGEGKYFSAQTAGTLKEALTAIRQEVVEPSRAPQSGITISTTKQLYTADEEMLFSYSIEFTDDLQGRQLQIVLAEESSGVQEWLQIYGFINDSETYAEESLGKLEPGNYELRVLLVVPPDRYADKLYEDRILAKTKFTVFDPARSGQSAITISTTKRTYTTDEEIVFSYSVQFKDDLQGRGLQIVVAEKSSGVQQWLRRSGDFIRVSGTRSSVRTQRLAPGNYELRVLLIIPPEQYAGKFFEDQVLAKAGFEVVR